MMSAQWAAGLRAMRASARPLAVVGRGRLSMTTSARVGLKESSSQTEHVDYDKHKQDSLAKQKKGAGHWKPELASDSEEAVRAERDGPQREDIGTLQERTKKSAEEAARTGGR